MSYYRLSDKVLLNLNSIEYIRETLTNSITSDYKYTLVMSSGNLFQITETEYQSILRTLENGNLVK